MIMLRIFFINNYKKQYLMIFLLEILNNLLNYNFIHVTICMFRISTTTDFLPFCDSKDVRKNIVDYL